MGGVEGLGGADRAVVVAFEEFRRRRGPLHRWGSEEIAEFLRALGVGVPEGALEAAAEGGYDMDRLFSVFVNNDRTREECDEFEHLLEASTEQRLRRALRTLRTWVHQRGHHLSFWELRAVDALSTFDSSLVGLCAGPRAAVAWFTLLADAGGAEAVFQTSGNDPGLLGFVIDTLVDRVVMAQRKKKKGEEEEEVQSGGKERKRQEQEQSREEKAGRSMGGGESGGNVHETSGADVEEISVNVHMDETTSDLKTPTTTTSTTPSTTPPTSSFSSSRVLYWANWLLWPYLQALFALSRFRDTDPGVFWLAVLPLVVRQYLDWQSAGVGVGIVRDLGLGPFLKAQLRSLFSSLLVTLLYSVLCSSLRMLLRADLVVDLLLYAMLLSLQLGSLRIAAAILANCNRQKDPKKTQ